MRQEVSSVSITAWIWICVGAALWLAGAGVLSVLIGRVVCRRDEQVPTSRPAVPGPTAIRRPDVAAAPSRNLDPRDRDSRQPDRRRTGR